MEYNLYNTGLQVYAGKCEEARMVVNTSSWRSGLYLLKATQNGRSRAFKIAVNNF